MSSGKSSDINYPNTFFFRLDDEGILKHYELLQLDALDKIYLPYMKSDFRWTNDEKRFILGKIKCEKHDLMPGEIRHLLNEYKQKHS